MAGVVIAPFFTILNEVQNYKNTLALRFEFTLEERFPNGLDIVRERQENDWHLRFQLLKGWFRHIIQSLQLMGVFNSNDFDNLPVQTRQNTYIQVLQLRGHFKQILLDIECIESEESAQLFFRV